MTHQGTYPGGWSRAFCGMAVLCLMFGAHIANAQNAAASTSSPRVVDDSASPGPSTPTPPTPAVDASVESSPVSPIQRGVYLPVHSQLEVRLLQAIDSAHAHNGQMLSATLTAPVRASDGRVLPAGTPVGVTVLAVAPAGKLQSRGELTLQVIHVGPVGALTDAQTFFGREGHKDLPDSAPAKGTEGTVSPGTTLRFHVAPAS